MTPETDQDQKVETAVTPGKGVFLPPPDGATQINLARERRDYALSRRHPARLGLPPVPRTVSDEELERGARIVGMRDPNPAPRHRNGGPVRKRDAVRTALLRLLPGGRS